MELNEEAMSEEQSKLLIIIFFCIFPGAADGVGTGAGVGNSDDRTIVSVGLCCCCGFPISSPFKAMLSNSVCCSRNLAMTSGGRSFAISSESRNRRSNSKCSRPRTCIINTSSSLPRLCRFTSGTNEFIIPAASSSSKDGADRFLFRFFPLVRFRSS